MRKIYTMSHIDDIKTRMKHIFLQDRAGLDDTVMQSVRQAQLDALRQFFAVHDYACEFEPLPDGSAEVTVRARVTRLTYFTEK